MTDLAETLGIKMASVPWNGVDRLPYILTEAYDFRKVTLDDTSCVFAKPRGVLPTVQAVVRNFERIREVEALPVILELNGLSGERRKALIAARVPFVATEQVYLPFLGVVLQERLYAEPKPREKLMPSSQLVLFDYLYQDSTKLYPGKLTEKLGLSAMQITRAVRQLQKLNLFEVEKDGVQVVIHGKTNRRAMFESAEPYLLDPVREILYLPRSKLTDTMPRAGISALAETTMLADDAVPTFAYYSKTDKLSGENALTDRETQVRAEVWKYAPTLLSRDAGIADQLSVIVSLRGERDERIEQAIDKILKELWG
jgi:DNA-binding MarR family transcriptional regulator